VRILTPTALEQLEQGASLALSDLWPWEWQELRVWLEEHPNYALYPEGREDHRVTLVDRTALGDCEVTTGYYFHGIHHVDVGTMERRLETSSELCVSSCEGPSEHYTSENFGVVFYGTPVAYFERDVYSRLCPLTKRRVTQWADCSYTRDEAWISQAGAVPIAAVVPEWAAKSVMDQLKTLDLDIVIVPDAGNLGDTLADYIATCTPLW